MFVLAFSYPKINEGEVLIMSSLFFLFTGTTEAQFIVPDWGDKADHPMP
jgi:hypothetical protein